MGKVISLKTKKVLSKKRIEFLASVNSLEKEKVSSADCSEDVPADCLIITGLSGNEYALTQSAINDVISGRRDVTELDYYKDIMPTIFQEWFNSIED